MGAFLKVPLILACVALIAVGSLPGARAYTMEQLCAVWWDAGFIGNPNDCQSWGYCSGQKLVSWGTCSDGLVYDSQSGSCKYENQTVCSTSAVTTCNNIKSPSYAADPNNCTQYAYCDGKGSVAYGSCPTGQLYSAGSNACVWGPNCPQEGPCRFMKNNIFIGDPSNCTSFIQCQNGNSKPGQCTNNNYYNFQTGKCQSNYPTGCDGNSGNGNTDNDGNPPAKNATICDSEYGASATGNQYFTDYQTCYGFYLCTSATDTGVWGSCKFGTHFDPDKQMCVSPVSYSCPYNRCGNLNLEFVTLINSDCNSFTYCATGGAGNCPAAYPFFDELSGNCVNEDPNYEICKVVT